MNPSWRRLAVRHIKDASQSKKRPAPYKAPPAPKKPAPAEPEPPPVPKQTDTPEPVPRSRRFFPSLREIPQRFRDHGPQAWRLAFWAPQLFIWLHFGIYLVGTIKDTGGPSMLPLLPVSDSAVWISRKYRRGRGIQVGDVISFAHPIGDYNAIKRVVGMPGDFVLRDTPGEGEGMMIQVPRGHCYVVGDNLPWSRDSRMLGPIPLALIQGKVNATLWPFTRIGRVENGLAPALIQEEFQEEIH